MNPYAQALRRAVAQSDRFARAPRSAQEKFQFEALSKLVGHAHRASPFWRERLDASGWSPGKPFDRAALERLPFLARADLQTRCADMKARPPDPAWGRIVPVSTSGSTGQPVTVDRTALQGLQFDTATILNHLWHRRDFSQKLVFYRYHPKIIRLPSWGHPAATLYRTGPSAVFATKHSTIDADLDFLDAEQPGYVLCQPGRAKGMAKLALEHGPRHRFSQMICLGETVTAETRALVREAFGAEIKDIYSAKDTGYLALQCPDYERHHVLADTVLIEIADDAGRPVEPGELGHVLVTILHSYAMPILRYAVGDVAAAGAACDCGLQLPVLEQIAGRTRNLARMPDGRLKYIQFPGFVLLRYAPVLEHRVIQRGDNRAELLLRCAVPLSPEQKAAIAQFIRDTFGWPLEVQVFEVKHIEAGPDGKREEFLRIE